MDEILLIIIGGIILILLLVLFTKHTGLSTLYRNTPLMVILIGIEILIGIYAYVTGHSEVGISLIISAFLTIIIVIVRRQEEGKENI